MSYTTPRISAYILKIKRGFSGLGLFAGEVVKKGDFIIEYFGPILTDNEADEKGGKYLFEIKKNVVVDGSPRGNTARYVNHSCRPNCEVEIDGKRLFIYAKRTIREGEELSYDYGTEYFNDEIGKHCRCVKCKK